MLQEAKQGWHPLIQAKEYEKKVNQMENHLSTQRWAKEFREQAPIALGEEQLRPHMRHMASIVSTASQCLESVERVARSGGESLGQNNCPISV